MRKKTVFFFVVASIFVCTITLLNLKIGIQVLQDPSPFQSSHWDIRWTVLFAAAFLAVGFLFFLSQYKAIIIFSAVGVGVLVILPIFTIGAGVAYLVLLLLVLVSLGIGERVLWVFMQGAVIDGLERFALAVLIGLGSIMFLVMIQGWLHAYNPLVTWLALGLLSIIFVLPNLKQWFLRVKETSSGWRHALLNNESLRGWALAFGILAILLIPSWLIALAPANRYDEMTYHLAAPMLYLQKGGIVRYPEGGTTYWMHYAEMLYTLALQTAGQPLPRMLHLFMGGMTVGTLFLIGRRLINSRVGIIAGIFFFSTPVVGYETATAYIDLFVTVYTTAFGFTLLVWWQDRNPRWLLVAGVLGGIGFGIKLTAGLMIAGLVIILLIATLAERRILPNSLWLGAMCAIILAIAMPWLIRDAFWTGDPFFPYGRMFLERFSGTALVSGTSGQPTFDQEIIRFFRYPIELVVNSRRYYHEAAGGMAAALPVLAAPLFIFSRLFSPSIKKVGLGLILACFITVGAMLIANSALMRYALPIFVWLAICAALNLEGLIVPLSSMRSKWWLVFFLSISLIYLFSTRPPLIMRLYDNFPQRLPVNYVFGRESYDEYLSRNMIVYDAFRFIDSQPNGPHRVLSIGNELRLYNKSRVDGVYDVREAHNVLSSAQTPSELIGSLTEIGYDYILINQPEVDYRPDKYRDPYLILNNSEFINMYCELIFVKNGVYVYRIDQNGVDLPQASNLLENHSFEEIIESNDFAHWKEDGVIEVSNHAFQGSKSVRLYGPLSIKGSGDIVQKVHVHDERIYTLGYWIRADQTAVFLMRVYWLEEGGTMISSDERWVNVDNTWKWYSLFVQSPQGASYAEVHGSLANKESALVDDVCIAEGQRCPVETEF